MGDAVILRKRETEKCGGKKKGINSYLKRSIITGVMWYILPVFFTYETIGLTQKSLQHFDTLIKSSEAKVDHTFFKENSKLTVYGKEKCIDIFRMLPF